jgi:hypothetical protein
MGERLHEHYIQTPIRNAGVDDKLRLSEDLE